MSEQRTPRNTGKASRREEGQLQAEGESNKGLPCVEAAPPAAGKTKRKPSKRYVARPEAQEMPACKAAGQQGARTKARVTQRKGTGVRDAPVHLADPLGMVKVPCRRRSGAVPHLLKGKASHPVTFLKSLKPSRQAAGSRDRQLPATPEQPSAQPEPWSEPLIGSSAKADRTVRAPDEQPLQPHMEGLSPQAASPTRSQQRDVPRASPARQPALASESAEQEDGMPDELVPLQASSAERVTELKRLLQVHEVVQRLLDGSTAVPAAAPAQPRRDCHAGSDSLLQSISGGEPQGEKKVFLSDLDWHINDADGEEGTWLHDPDMSDDSLPDMQNSQEDEEAPVKPIDKLRSRMGGHQQHGMERVCGYVELQASGMQSTASSSVDLSIDTSVHSDQSPAHSPGAKFTRGLMEDLSGSMLDNASPALADMDMHVPDSGGRRWQRDEGSGAEDPVQAFSDWCAGLQT